MNNFNILAGDLPSMPTLHIDIIGNSPEHVNIGAALISKHGNEISGPRAILTSVHGLNKSVQGATVPSPRMD